MTLVIGAVPQGLLQHQETGQGCQEGWAGGHRELGRGLRAPWAGTSVRRGRAWRAAAPGYRARAWAPVSAAPAEHSWAGTWQLPAPTATRALPGPSAALTGCWGSLPLPQSATLRMIPHLDDRSQLVSAAEIIQILGEAIGLGISAQGTDVVEELQFLVILLELSRQRQWGSVKGGHPASRTRALGCKNSVLWEQLLCRASSPGWAQPRCSRPWVPVGGCWQRPG